MDTELAALLSVSFFSGAGAGRGIMRMGSRRHCTSLSVFVAGLQRAKASSSEPMSSEYSSRTAVSSRSPRRAQGREYGFQRCGSNGSSVARGVMPSDRVVGARRGEVVSVGEE